MARNGVGSAFSSLMICSSTKGIIFHFTVLVAAGETERAFRSRILESWAGSLWASALVVCEDDHLVAFVGISGSGGFAGGPETGGSPGGISEFVGSTEPLGP